ncbi:hypothetical protein LSH36_602g01034 [Paralvinella palmiformis]|uniref:G-protein coupled receptors family 1 profile domain-containing protein n=1 Tax=Paralvinella palmiformis TaxID=53620 RepID=A0AAD9J508_9ANNE|nr:hypothetical protein LSH36_602g01034 [Paralvinella palmiformis]
MRNLTTTDMSETEYDIAPSENGSQTINLTNYLSNSSSTPALLFVPASYYLLIRDVYFVLNGFIVCSGLLFNSVALMVFATSPTLRRSTTGHYLIALSLADSTYLLGDFFRWLASKSHSFTEYTKYANLLNKYDVVCKLVNTIRYTAMLCSSSITVAITTERFLTVKWPLKIAQISTPRSAKIVIAFVAVGSLTLCIFPLWCLKIYPVAQTGHDSCQIDVSKIELFKTMVWVAIRVMALIIPSVIVSFFTAWIIVLLKKRDRDKYDLQAHISPIDRRYLLERQLTVMLVAVAIAFVLLRLPYTIVWDINQFKRSIWKPLDPWLSYHIYVAYKLTDILAITNYAINFFLYFLCGSTFREQLMKMCRCKKNKTRRLKRWSIGTFSSLMSRRSSSMNEGSIRASHLSQQQQHAQRKESCEMTHLRQSSKDSSCAHLHNCETNA